MTVDDRTRLNLHRKLSDVLGPEEADTLMSHLPPVTWDQVANKYDLETFRELIVTELRIEMQVMGAVIRSDVNRVEAALRSDMNSMAASLRSNMKDLETTPRTGRADLHSEFAEGMNRQIRWFVATVMAWSAVLLAAVRLLP